MSGSEMKEMLDLGKWHLKTIESVRHVLEQNNLPCVGFSLVFYNPLNKEEAEFGFETRLADDPHENKSDEVRNRIKLAFEFIAAGIKKIMAGVFDNRDEMDEFIVRGDFH